MIHYSLLNNLIFEPLGHRNRLFLYPVASNRIDLDQPDLFLAPEEECAIHRLLCGLGFWEDLFEDLVVVEIVCRRFSRVRVCKLGGGEVFFLHREDHDLVRLVGESSRLFIPLKATENENLGQILTPLLHH